MIVKGLWISNFTFMVKRRMRKYIHCSATQTFSCYQNVVKITKISVKECMELLNARDTPKFY